MTPPSDDDGAQRDHDGAAAFHDLSLAIDRSTVRAQKCVDGTYGSSDAVDDLTWFAATLWEWTAAFAFWMTEFSDRSGATGADELPRVGHGVQAKLLPGVSGPIALAAGTFHAIGWPPEFDVGPTTVVFDSHPPRLEAGEDSFTVTLNAQVLPVEATSRTIIYEGVIFDAATGAPATYLIRFVKPPRAP